MRKNRGTDSNSLGAQGHTVFFTQNDKNNNDNNNNNKNNNNSKDNNNM